MTLTFSGVPLALPVLIFKGSSIGMGTGRASGTFFSRLYNLNEIISPTIQVTLPLDWQN